jgi:hypothetical protein
MAKITGILWGIWVLWSFGCRSGERKAADKTADSTWTDRRANISFVFPSKGYGYDHRQQLIQACLDGVKHDLEILQLPAFTDTFTIRFLDSRQDMNRFVGHPNSGTTLTQPYRIIYMVVNEQENGPPIPHELMHMICLVDWGDPDPTSLWMHEGLAAFSQNSCNGFSDEQIYRYLAAHRMLLPIDSLGRTFYQEPEMVTYHQAGWMAGYLLGHYGVEKVRELWQQGIYHSNEIYGTPFSQVEADIKAAAERDYAKAPDIDWKSFEVGCR